MTSALSSIVKGDFIEEPIRFLYKSNPCGNHKPTKKLELVAINNSTRQLTRRLANEVSQIIKTPASIRGVQLRRVTSGIINYKSKQSGRVGERLRDEYLVGILRAWSRVANNSQK